MSPHDDLSIGEAGRHFARSIAAAAVALGFIAYLFWSLSAAAPVPSLVGTGARGLLPAVAPVPYVSPEERVDA